MSRDGKMCQERADPQAAARISCGVAGWSYPDWEGYVYSKGVKDKLRFVAGYVDLIEINSSFYRAPGPTTSESWLDRTRDLPDFFFTAKLHQDITHRGVFGADTVESFRRGIEPMANAGKLRHLLAQFRYDFSDSEPARRHLETIRRTFGDLANIALELRHNSWQAPDALDFVKSLGVTAANLDYPTARNSFNLRVCRVGEHAYFRLHGRNAKAWFSSDAGRNETYNYLYSGKELDEIRDRAIEIAGMSKTLTLVANNHYQGKEMVNALQLKAMFTGKRVPVPPALLEKYPQLKEIAES